MLDSADGAGMNLPTAPESILDSSRVHSCKRQLPNGKSDRIRMAVVSASADPRDAFVGEHMDQACISNGNGLDFGDFHDSSVIASIKAGTSIEQRVEMFDTGQVLQFSSIRPQTDTLS
tara:strand:- start:356 stop:709 length:354 start_codon:yes stop_codon:yes gene_type:complete